MELVKSLNLGLRFLLEMGALGAVGVRGFPPSQGGCR